MPTYDEAKAQSFAKATTKTVTGVPLDVPKNHPLKQARFQPIQACVGDCVADPCLCDATPVVWIGESVIHARSVANRRNQAGEELYDFSVDVDAPVIVESFRRINVGDLSKLREPVPSPPTGNPTFIVRPRPGAHRSPFRSPGGGDKSRAVRADPGCSDYEVTESGVWYCFVESSEHYCIYMLC